MHRILGQKYTNFKQVKGCFCELLMHIFTFPYMAIKILNEILAYGYKRLITFKNVKNYGVFQNYLLTPTGLSDCPEKNMHKVIHSLEMAENRGV